MKKLGLFPNPFSDRIHVKSKGLSEIKVYDMTSRNILQEEFINSISLYTGELMSGLYVYELYNGRTIKKGKLIKE